MLGSHSPKLLTELTTFLVALVVVVGTGCGGDETSTERNPQATQNGGRSTESNRASTPASGKKRSQPADAENRTKRPVEPGTHGGGSHDQGERTRTPSHSRHEAGQPTGKGKDGASTGNGAGHKANGDEAGNNSAVEGHGADPTTNPSREGSSRGNAPPEGSG
jgi:hypothetical protein